jgi:hypothetical protein
MAQIAFLRPAIASGFAFDRAPAFAPSWTPVVPAKGALDALSLWMSYGYRPERHYMRGGRTPGAKSLARH